MSSARCVQGAGCKVQVDLYGRKSMKIDFRDRICDKTHDDAIAHTLQCQPSTRRAQEVPAWECSGAARHWDCRHCRDTVCARCSSTHWTKKLAGGASKSGPDSLMQSSTARLAMARTFFRAGVE